MNRPGQNPLPDDAALSALASAMFQEALNLPGREQAPAAPARPVPLGAPQAPGALPVAGSANLQPLATTLPVTPPFKVSAPAVAEALAVPSVITPRVLPVQAQTGSDIGGLQSTLLPMLPKGGGPAAGVPEAWAAQPPPAGAPEPPAATAAAETRASPFYFLDSLPAGLPGTPALRLPADSFGIPAAQRPPAPGAAAAGAATPTHSRFYFLDAAPQRAANDVPAVPAGRGAFDVHAIRRDFPILSERVSGGKQLVWLDNAATTQKPQPVIDRLAHFYAHENSNVHRAAHELAARSTDAYEKARKTVARFIGASEPEEIIFVRGTTEAINLVAQTWGWQNIGADEEILISHLEHHANIVPWQMLAADKGARLRVIPVDDSGQVRLDEYQKLLNSRTKIVSVTQVSNALGTVVPVKEIIDLAHRVGARVLVDGAQSVSHLAVNVQTLDADFFVFSGHKIFGPTGIGVVYGKRDLLERMPPYQGGGNMIQDVTFDKTVYHGAPARFEAGTGNIADAVGLGAALEYVESIGLPNIARYEHELLEYGMDCLRSVPGLRLIGTAREKTSVMSFVLDGFTTQEIGQALSEEGIAVRSGHHCAQPILRRFGLEATVRPSLAFYNTYDEIDQLAAVVRRLATTRRS